MEKTEYRNKRMMVNFTESEYEQLLAEAEKSHIPKAVLCRKLIVDGFVRIEYREPAEMSMLEKIFDNMSKILDSDMEMLRQLRLMGDWTEESRKTIEEQIKEMLNIIRIPYQKVTWEELDLKGIDDWLAAKVR